jgi:hypothetical protein
MAKTRRRLLKQFAILNASMKFAFPPKSTIRLIIRIPATLPNYM